jgi:protoheme IX farnesyltransferase
VVQLVVFCAVVGMLLAAPTWPDWGLAVPAIAGIWLTAGAAAAFNCLIERHVDLRMRRTAWRPTATGRLHTREVLTFAGGLCLVGSILLWRFVNPLTMALTLATFVGYSVICTVILKPRTPQNIVIGGLSGAMPPVLGWTAIRGDLGAEARVLCLIVFLWTPPHFWALARCSWLINWSCNANLKRVPPSTQHCRVRRRAATSGTLRVLVLKDANDDCSASCECRR